MTQEEFIKLSLEIHNNKYLYDKVIYVNKTTKVIITCPIHGDFEQLPKEHLKGRGCNKCQLKSLTILYAKLVEKFPNLEILFEVGSNIVPWLEKQRFDIYIPLLNIAIEYNGHQHYTPIEHFGGTLGLLYTQEHDELKRLKCKDNGCLLYELKYNYTNEDFNNLCNQIDDRVGLIEKCEKGGKL